MGKREIPLTLAATLTLHNKYTSTSSNYSTIVQKKDFNAGLHLTNLYSFNPAKNTCVNLDEFRPSVLKKRYKNSRFA